MIKEQELTTESAPCAWHAARDAERRSQNNRHLYTSEQRGRARTAADLIHGAYKYDQLYINYRKTFIAIKVEHAEVRNRRMLKVMDDIFAERGYTKAVTPHGVVYRLPKTDTKG